ncbi:hypothetical protein TNCV_2343141 [Trichonephila clavipes]|nr:hypothetical protein TNCV_2343141 [Trichonephila clavipes]
MFTQCGEQPGCILACIYNTMEATFFFRETTVKSSPSVTVRSPMPSALTTRALAPIGPATFVLLASELLSSAELSSSIAERVSSLTAAGGGVVLTQAPVAGAEENDKEENVFKRLEFAQNGRLYEGISVILSGQSGGSLSEPVEVGVSEKVEFWKPKRSQSSKCYWSAHSVPIGRESDQGNGCQATPTPSRSSSEIDVSNEFTTPVKCKRTSKSPNKGKAKKAKPSEEVIALSNSFSAIAHLEVDVKDLNEDNVVDTAPGTEEEDSIPRHL